jgi:hypothetical protein
MFETIFCVVLAILGVSVYYNIKFGLIILRIEDSIEECLDQLDERYRVISKILEKPIFFDSIEVRQTVQEIRSSQELLLKVANRMSNLQEPVKDEKDQ